MTRKLTFLILAMLFAILGPGAEAWGQTRESYTITFKVGSGDGTSASTSTACSTIVSDGSDYLSGNLATATKVYYNGGSGLKLGASSNAGTIKMNLSSYGQVTPTSIVVNAKLYNSSKATTLKVNGSETQDLAADFADYTFNITSKITYLELVTSKYAWISSITVNYGGSTATLESIEVSGTPTKTEYETGEEFDPAGLVVTGTYDDASTETITSGITWDVTPNPLTAGTTSVRVTATVDDITSPVYTVNGLTVNEHIVTPGTYQLGTDWNALFDTDYSGSFNPSANSLNLNGTSNDITLNVTNGTSTNGYIKTGDFRWYNGYTLTFTVPQGYVITNITFTKGGKNPENLTTETGSFNYNSQTYESTWNGSSQSITFSATGTGGVSTIQVTYAMPSSVATPTFSLEAGTYTEAQNVEIFCETVDATIYYTTDGTNPTAESTEYTDAITVSETTTIKAIAYVGNEASNVATATYTILTPLTSMDGIFDAATEAGSNATDILVTFDDWVISGVKSSNAYLTDGTKGLIIYESDHGFEVGDKLSGTAACKVQLYNGAAELTTLTSSTDGLTVTKGGSVIAQEVSIADLNGVNTGAVITLNNVTYSGSDKFTDGAGNEIKAYNAFMTLPEFTSGRQYNITGVYIQYGGTKEIAPRNEDDIYLIPDTEYAINLNPNAYGTISADLETASAGQTVTLSATPIEHFHLTSWTVLDDDANEIAVSDNQFIMPASDVEVEATFAEDELYAFTYYYNGEYYTDYLAYGGTLITLEEDPDMSPVGFSFVGWSTSVASTDIIEGTTYTLNEDVDFYAVFEKQGTNRGSSNFVKVTTEPEDWSGEYLLVYEGDSYNYAWTGVDAGRCHTDVVISDNVIASQPTDAVTLTLATMDGGYSIRVNGGTNDGKYIGKSSYSNGLDIKEIEQLNTLSMDEYGIIIAAEAEQSGVHCTMRYNKSSGDSNERFRYYKPGQEPVQLYKKQGSEPTANRRYTRVYDDVYTFAGTDLNVEGPSIVVSDYTLTVTGTMTNTNAANLVIEDGAQLYYTNGENVNATFQKSINGYTGTNDHYYLIANPTDNTTVANLTNENGYDLYTFNPAGDEQGREWINEKANPLVESEKGYLYANSGATTTLEFAGKLIPAASKAISLTYAGDDNDFPGFNLIGNPYACNATISGDYTFLKIDDDAIIPSTGSVAPCEGIFVEATAAEQSVTFTPALPASQADAPSAMSIEVSQNRGNVIDRAIVRFDGANNMHKFMLNPDRTNIRLAKNGEEFAAISTEAEGELPVNFKAEKDGTYTISVNTENVDAEYLHLIDNMTGADTDLLSTSSYTFDAKTSDYASRFKLVFGVKNDNEEMSQASSFAYINNGEIVISNEGRATLQVIDVMGRIVSSEEINGECRISTNGLTAGLYILNLNGMTQKIVVR